MHGIFCIQLLRMSFRLQKLHMSPEDEEHVHREEEDVANDYTTRQVIANVANEF